MKAGDSNDTKRKQLSKDKRSASVLSDIDAKVFERVALFLSIWKPAIIGRTRKRLIRKVESLSRSSQWHMVLSMQGPSQITQP